MFQCDLSINICAKKDDEKWREGPGTEIGH